RRRVGLALLQPFLDQRISQKSVAELRRFERGLIALRCGEYVHALLVGELRQPLRVHRPASLLFGFEGLSRITSVYDEDELGCVERFENLLKLLVADAVREYGLKVELRLQFAFARVAEVVRDEVEAPPLRRAVSGEVDDDRVLRLRCLQLFERLRRARRKRPRLFARQATQRRLYVLLRRVAVEQRDDFDAASRLDERALTPHLLDEVGRVRRSELEVVVFVLVLVDADGENVCGRRAAQTLRAAQRERRVRALHVVAVEGVGRELVLARDDRHDRFERCVPRGGGDRAVLHVYERAVAEQAQVARARGRVRPIDSCLDRARCAGRCAGSRVARERDFKSRLATVYLCDVLRGARMFSREYVREKVWVEELVE